MISSHEDKAISGLSVRTALQGHDIVLTGATGYLGSLVLEQLLRCVPGVRTVYVLVRARGKSSASLRLLRLLHSGLFNRVRDQPELLSKVCLVPGDLSDLVQEAESEQAAKPAPSEFNRSRGNSSSCSDSTCIPAEPDLQPKPQRTAAYWNLESRQCRVLTAAELLELQETSPRPVLVLHCAASIALWAPMKTLLSENYMGTMHVLAFARRVKASGFVHVSTAFVNASKRFLPEGTILEQHYPMEFGITQVDPEAEVAKILTETDKMAELRGNYLCDHWSLWPYTLSKSLTEAMVLAAHSDCLPVTVVRPSLVGAVAGDLYPGYIGNFAGLSAVFIGRALGMLDAGIQLRPYGHFDVVPGDYASSIIIAAAAAMVSGSTEASGSPQPMIYHAASQCMNPWSNAEIRLAVDTVLDALPRKIPPLGRKLNVCCNERDIAKPYTWHWYLLMWWMGVKVWVMATILRWTGNSKAGKMLTALNTFIDKQLRHSHSDHKLWFDTSNVQALEQRLSQEERALFPMVWRGAWAPYVHAWMAYILHVCFKMSVPKTRIDHAFEPIPSPHIPNPQVEVEQAAANSASSYTFTPKHVRDVRMQIISGACLSTWLCVLVKWGRFIDWHVYFHRVLLITFLAALNSLRSLPDWLLYSRRIKKQVLHPEPVFILGNHRSGTTHLHNLLSLDPAFTWMTTFQAASPSTFLTMERAKKVFRFLLLKKRPMDNIPASFDAPQEDEIAMVPYTGGLSHYMTWLFPRHTKQLKPYLTFAEASPKDRRLFQESLVTLFKKVTLKNCLERSRATKGEVPASPPEPKPLLIKSPVHTGRLPLLREMFPKAKYIYIHRDPLTVFSSTCHLVNTLFWYNYLQIPESNEQLTEYVLDMGKTLYRSYLEERHKVPSGQLVEISYTELDTEPLATLKKVYASLGWAARFEELAPRFKEYLETLKSYEKNNHHRLSPELEARVRSEWECAFKAWGYA